MLSFYVKLGGAEVLVGSNVERSVPAMCKITILSTYRGVGTKRQVWVGVFRRNSN